MAQELELPTLIAAVGPGCDAAAYPPEYEVHRKEDTQRTFLELCTDSATGQMQLKEAAARKPPVPPDTMKPLPTELFEHRLKERESPFLETLSKLAEQILRDCPEEKRFGHLSKTYFLISQIYQEVQQRKGEEFFALGVYRGAERARAHMFSNSACGLYELGMIS